VRPGAQGGDGSQASPLGTLAAAIPLANAATPIYVCATEGALDEAVELTSPVTLVGGVDCDTWTETATQTEWTSPVGTTPLVVRQAASGFVVEGFAITASDAVAPGASSVAVLVDGATGTLRDSTLTAGAGADGEAAEGYADPATAGPEGKQGDAGCAGESFEPGGAGGAHMCNAVFVYGGKGGDGLARRLSEGTGTKGEGGPAGLPPLHWRGRHRRAQAPG
jgi:hypothetical protein